MTKFNQVKKQLLPKLEQFVPVVARVHGGSHPEFHEAQNAFDMINEKIKTAGADKPELDQEFAKLREITNNYLVPEDVCESYEAVYNMLAELDQSYHA